MTSSISAILYRAADRVARGWGQVGVTRTYNSVDRPCMMVAVQQEAERLGRRKVTAAIGAALRLLGFSRMRAAMEWNDDPSRTQSEVVAKLRDAASLARSEEGE